MPAGMGRLAGALAFSLVVLAGTSAAGLAGSADRFAAVSADGLLRWQDDGSEVALFGVNYCVPFTIEYGALGQLRLDRRRVIDQDLLHLQRLGLTCLRMPVWDREISDREGNLIANDHLALLDHLIAVGKQRGLYMILTAMVWYPTDNESPGFATLYTMPQMTGDSGAPRAAQRRYLAQFVQHRNQETGLTYAQDPAVLAFELINEPLYADGASDAQVSEYIDALAGAIRETGCRKPIFYNGWSDRSRAVATSSADGLTFGCYPTGLVSGGMLTGNFLSTVDDYPSMRDECLRSKAKGLYEFDAADVPWGYMYPAMARAFRSGGAQFASQFQYDAWPLAASNCCWQTHFLSLPYTPGKAVSLLIAGEAFRRLPRLARYGRTPAADRFGPFRVSYERRLSEMVTETEYLHSNDTSTPPPTPEHLVRIAGVGTSPVAAYEGTGAYFLDRLAPGVWRLEVYPDCVWTADPFARRTVDDETARLLWTDRPLTLRLPDLGSDFRAEPADRGNALEPRVRNGSLVVRPGVYRLCRRGVKGTGAVDGEYFAPPPVSRPPAVWLQTQDAAVAGEALPMEALCTADDAALFLCCRVGERWQRMPMRRVHAYHYVGEVPAEALRPGRLGCAVALRREGRVTSFPGGLAGWPGQAPERRPEVLFDATQLREAPEAKVVNCPGARAQAAVAEGALRVTSSALDPGRDTVVEVRVPLRPPTAADLPIVRIRARSLEPATTAAQITVIQDNGRTYATNVSLSSAFREVDVPLEEWWGCWGTWGGRLEPQRARELSIAYGTWILNAAAAQPQGLEVAAVALVPRPSTWELPVQPLGPPVPLLVPEVVARRHRWQPGLRLMVVPGPTGESALEMAHAGFGPPPDCVVISWTVPPQSPARRRVLAQCDVLRLKLRHRAPAARALQVGLTEDDGAPWGVDVPVTANWQTVAVPLTRLQFFRQWAHPEGRGGGGDRFRPERLQQVTLAFGAWLDPARAAEPHIIQVAGVELARSEDATEW